MSSIISNKNLTQRIQDFLKIANKHLLVELSKLNSFEDRLTFCEKHFQRLGAGSSRIVFKLDDESALKLAKNQKGIAQNKSEKDNHIEDPFFNKIDKSDKNYYWVTVPLAEKITTEEFEDQIGVDFDSFGQGIRYDLRENSRSNKKKEKPDNYKDLQEIPLYQHIVEVGLKYHLMAGDFARIQNYGLIDDKIIVLDAGLDTKVYDKFYNKK